MTTQGNEIDPRITEAIRHNNLVCFVGSGLSKNIGLPNWIGMVRCFVDELAVENRGLETLKAKAYEDHADPMTILKLLSARGYADRCKQLLAPLIDIDLTTAHLENQRSLWALTEKIITTNYDCALEQALPEELKDDIRPQIPSDRFLSNGLDLKDVGFLIKIHGSIRKPESCILFQEDYDALYKHNHEFLKALKFLSTGQVLLFIGYSVRDVEIQYLLKNMYALFPAMTNHFIVTAYPNDYEKFGVKTLSIKDDNDLTSFIEMLVAYKKEFTDTLVEEYHQIDLEYANRKGLLISFEKEDARRKAKDDYLAELDKKDIFDLESICDQHGEEDPSLINHLVQLGREEALREYLLLKRQAKFFQNIADKRQLEGAQWDDLYDASLERFVKAVDVGKGLFQNQGPELAQLYNEIGNVLLRQGNFTEARAWYVNALALIPENSIIASLGYTNLGNIANENRDLDEAYRFYSQAYKIHGPDRKMSLNIMRNLAGVLLKLKRFTEAVDLESKIIGMDEPSDLRRAADYQTLGLAQLRMKEYLACAESYAMAVSLFFRFYGQEKKEFLKFYNDIGHCYAQAQVYDQAVRYFEKALQLETESENIFITTNNLGEAYFKMKDYTNALATFKKNLNYLQQFQTEEQYPEAYDYLRKWMSSSEEKLREVGRQPTSSEIN